MQWADIQRKPGVLTLIFLGIIAIGLALGQAQSDQPTSGGPMVGLPAPEVVADMLDGTTWRLSEHLETDGRPVILNLWGSWCPPCRQEIPELSRFAVDHPEFLVIGVAVRDQESDTRAAADELQPRYPVGLDATGRLPDAYVGFGWPATYLIDAGGMIRAQLIGGTTETQLEELIAGLDLG